MWHGRTPAVGSLLAALGAVLFTAPLGAFEGTPAAYATPPAIHQPRVSPSGRRVLFLRSTQSGTEVFVGDLSNGAGFETVVVRHGRSHLNACDWATDERIVCSRMRYHELRRNRVPRRGFPFNRGVQTRLFAIDYDGSDLLNLVPSPDKPPAVPLPNGRMSPGYKHYPFDESKHGVVSLLPHDPDHILVELMRGVIRSVGVYRLNIRDNRLKLIVPAEVFADRWSADGQGRVRVGVGTSADTTAGGTWGQRRMYVEDGAGGFEATAAPQFGTPWLPPTVLGFTADGESAYLQAHDAEAGRIVVLQAASATLAVERRVAAFADRDATAVAVSGTSCGVVGFAHEDAAAFTWLDEDFGRDIEALDAKTSGRIRSVPSVSADCRRVVAVADGGGRTPSVYLHDRDSGATRRIGSRNPTLDDRLANTRDVSFTARDGRSIDATFTVPRGRAGGPPPLVVLLDVGPLGPAEGYSPWTEFLASRGYAVLAPRVRGMAGRGDEHFVGGLTMWGERMRADMADGVRWAAAQGLAAADRVCYVGRRFGGYMALAGAYDERSGARCAAAFAFEEPSLRTFYNDRVSLYNWFWRNWIGPHWTGEWYHIFWADENPLLSGGDAGSATSANVSPLVDAPHPGFPVLLATEAGVQRFDEKSRGYARAVEHAASVRRALPPGSEREIEFLVALEAMLESEVGVGDEVETRPSAYSLATAVREDE